MEREAEVIESTYRASQEELIECLTQRNRFLSQIVVEKLKLLTRKKRKGFESQCNQNTKHQPKNTTLRKLALKHR